MSLTDNQELIVSKLILVEAIAFNGAIEEYFESIHNNEKEFLDRVNALLYAYDNKENLEVIIGRKFSESEMYIVGAIVLYVWKYIECGD